MKSMSSLSYITECHRFTHKC